VVELELVATLLLVVVVELVVLDDPPVLLTATLLVPLLLVPVLEAFTELVPMLLAPELSLTPLDVAEDPVDEAIAPDEATTPLERAMPLEVLTASLFNAEPELVPGSTVVVAGPQATRFNAKSVMARLNALRDFFPPRKDHSELSLRSSCVNRECRK